VTRHVAPLSADCISAALDAGEVAAQSMQARGLIGGALLVLQGIARVIGDLPLPATVPHPGKEALAHA
jgi:hypothetical protein